MYPLDLDLPIDELQRRARLNATSFDLQAFQAWLSTQPADVQALAALRPPNALYHVVGWGDHGPTLCVVIGYRAADDYGPALIIVRPLKSTTTLGVLPTALRIA